MLRSLRSATTLMQLACLGELQQSVNVRLAAGSHMWMSGIGHLQTHVNVMSYVGWIHRPPAYICHIGPPAYAILDIDKARTEREMAAAKCFINRLAYVQPDIHYKAIDACSSYWRCNIQRRAALAKSCTA